MSFTLKCNREEEHGEEYMKFNDFDMKLKIDDVKLQLNDLFKGNQQLTETTNAALMENSKVLAADFETFLAESIGETVLSIVKAVFNRFPMSTLMPE